MDNHYNVDYLITGLSLRVTLNMYTGTIVYMLGFWIRLYTQNIPYSVNYDILIQQWHLTFKTVR